MTRRRALLVYVALLVVAFAVMWASTSDVGEAVLLLGVAMATSLLVEGGRWFVRWRRRATKRGPSHRNGPPTGNVL